MDTLQKTTITVGATIDAPVEKVWERLTDPHYIMQWNHANDEWQSTFAEHELKVGGKFRYRMESKDEQHGFDFSGTFAVVEPHQELSYVLDDNRKVQILLESRGNQTKVTETFEAEQTNSLELQQMGWQAILDNFKKHVETKGIYEKLHFETTIDAPVSHVVQTMLDKDTYKDWTAEFNPSSYFKGSWDKGAKILFIGADENGATGGMVSRIKENIPNKFISIEHIGILKGEEEVTSGPEIETWAGALENYHFEEIAGKTKITVMMDSNQEFKDYFSETWPKALARLKSICENK